MKTKDWSLNLEHEFYEQHPEEIVKESISAVLQTNEGCYVNLVTPGASGDPREGLISQLKDHFAAEQIAVKEIRYIDQCGCGGYVTRVFR